MTIRKIARMGHPILRKKARALTKKEILSPEIQTLVADMIETMHDASGIGLAAPQVHESIQLAIIELQDENQRYPGMGKQDLLVLINPVVKVLDKATQSFWEGCLSVPELRGLVERPRKISVRYLDLKAKEREIIAEDFLATVFQHELDHLDGTLYIDKIKDTRKLAFTAEYQRYHAPEPGDEEQELDD